MNRLIHCINCHEVHLETPFDQCPEYEFYLFSSPENLQGIERDDFQDFLRIHRGHRLEDLKIIEDSYISEKPYFEPIKVSYFKATNGKENFVIKKFRENIDEPLRYQLIIGDFSLKCIGIEIQSKEVARQLGREFKADPIGQDKIASFLELCQHIAETVDIKNLERSPEESLHPLEIYYKMDDFSLAYLLKNCRNIFEGQKYLDIEDFIRRHKEDGVLLLKATYRIEIIERDESIKKIAAAQMPL